MGTKNICNVLISFFLLFFLSNRSLIAKGIQAQKKESKNKSSLNQDLKTNTMETITLGAGCFWCVESIYQKFKGIIKVTSGYSGGKKANPTYKEVCSEANDHIEVCQIVYDPKIISTKNLLRVFFYSHDPTTINRQGNDIGFQYNSVIFFHNEEQKKTALEKIKELNESHFYSSSIVTQVVPMKNFYKAENYHQNYYNLNTKQPYCQSIIKPKLDRLAKMFKEELLP